MKNKNILKSKDLLMKIIGICGICYAISILLLFFLGIAYSQELTNDNLKNSVIIFGTASLAIYITQLISSIILWIGFQKLTKEVNWTNNNEIHNTCICNAIVVFSFVGFVCFPFILKLKKITLDISNSYLTTKLNSLVEFKMPYDKDNYESKTNLLNVESYNFEIPLDVMNTDQETVLTNK